MWSKLVSYYKKNPFLYTLEAITLVLILSTGIYFKQTFLRMLPLCLSLLVMFLQANVNRYNFLLGGCNAILYAIAYFSLGLPSQALYALLFSFPLQILSFLNWKRKADGASTRLLRMSLRFRILLGCGAVAVILGLSAIYLGLFDYASGQALSMMVLDNTVSVLGIVATVLMLLRFVEYAPLQIISQICALTIYFMKLATEPEQITFIIYSVYAMICASIAIRNMRKRYLAQQ